jgi:DNA-binding transcriptional LysR family regulator
MRRVATAPTTFARFLAVVDRGSLTAAARHLGRSLQSISRALAAVEREVGIELVRRTRRRSNPTEVERPFYAARRPALRKSKRQRPKHPTGIRSPRASCG